MRVSNNTRALGARPDSMTKRSMRGSSNPLMSEPTNEPCLARALSQGALSVYQA